MKRLSTYNKFNEELKSSTYLSAAQKLQKMGHSRRPEVLKAWAEEVRKRETDRITKKNLEESEKLGLYQIKINTNKKSFDANVYVSLSWVNDTFDDSVYDFKNDESSSLYLQFSFGVIPADAETLDNFIECLSDFLSPSYGIWWLQDMWLCVSKSSSSITEQDIKMYPDLDTDKDLIPSPNCSFEGIEISTAKFSNRQSAMKFKQTLYDIFSSKLIYRQSSENPGGMAERIREEIVGEHGFGFDEYLRFVEVIKLIRVNSLYRD
jgi:hypothetical protein